MLSTEYLDMPGGKKKVVDGFNFLNLGNFTSLITNIIINPALKKTGFLNLYNSLLPCRKGRRGITAPTSSNVRFCPGFM